MNVIALVGRANVGKSTLFNRLCGGRDALVHDQPGLTRDRRYGVCNRDSLRATVVDTGGMMEESALARLVDEQVELALTEADLALLLVDAKFGFGGVEDEIAGRLRKLGKDAVVVLNKSDVLSDESLLHETSRLGFGNGVSISALSGLGIPELLESIKDRLPVSETDHEVSDGIRVALVGRSNVGKSTLINTIVQSKRCIVFDEIGTTRDSVDVPIQRSEGNYVFIDTAGIRRKGRVSNVLEKFSIVSAFRAMDRAQVALLLVDATEGIVDQDLHILQYAFESGTGILVVANKWDSVGSYEKQQFESTISRKLRFADWLDIRYISALNGTGVDALFAPINRIHAAGKFEVSTSELNQVLESAVRANSPPTVGRHQIKLRYAHRIGTYPPSIMIHGNQTENLPRQYIRYLEGRFREELGLHGLPVVLKFKSSSNPFKDRRNVLSPRQRKRRDRLIRHRVKR